MSGWFEPGDEALGDFWLVYDRHYDAIVESTMRMAAAHREFAPILAAMSPADLAKQDQESRARLRLAIFDGAWQPYEDSLRAQGQIYARMGISYAGWYDLVGDFQSQMIPLIVEAFVATPPRLAGALKAMQSFVDRTMMLIGDEYLRTKEKLVFAERAIAEAHEERYRMLFDNGPVPMWVYDRQTLAFLAVNRAAVELYGYSEDEFLGMTIEGIRFPEDLALLRAENDRLKSDRGRVELGEWRHRKKDGGAIFVELKLQSFIYLGKRAHLVVAADVTDKKRAARAIAESEERYRTLVAATSSVVWTAGGDGRFAAPQPSWQAHTGQSESEYAGLGWLDAVFVEDRPRVAAAWRDACDTRSVFAADGRLWHAASGRHRWFVARAVPLVGDDGVREWIGTIADVDEQKQAEQPGRFFALSLDLLCVAGIDGYFKRINPSFSILGYTEEELLARPFLDYVHPDDLPATLAEVDKLAHGQRTVHFENRYRCKDGSWRDLLWASAADPTSGLIYAAARDITERKRTEAERAELTERLVEQNEELTRASRAKSDFLAMMSHELRTPLNSIIGFSEVLSDQKVGTLGDKQQRYVHNVLQSGRHLLGLINDLLDLSKIEAGRLEVLREPCATLSLAAEAIATLQPLADARKVEVILDRTGASLPPVSADAARFKQVLYNLLSNAIKFTSAGGRVRVECALADGGRFVRVTVRDSGSGIARQELPRLFTPFTQLANAKGRGGTGLGLSLTRRLVELMGGSIGVDSELGVGTTFHVDLPVDGAVTTLTAATAQAGDSPLVLVVDDDAAARELLVLTLHEAGFRTLAVASGDEAIAQARLHQPAAITLDIMLPTIDGWDVMRLLKSDAATAEIPVVIVSISSDRAKAFSLGAHEHLVKPVSREALLGALSRRGFVARAGKPPVHVLAIDDDLKQLELIRAALEPHGFAVRTESSGQAGIEAARAQRVDVVLLDLVMPELSGVEVVAALRADPRTRALPILLLTAHQLSPSDRARLNGDVAAILSKGSMRMQDLLGEVTRILRRPPPAIAP